MSPEFPPGMGRARFQSIVRFDRSVTDPATIRSCGAARSPFAHCVDFLQVSDGLSPDDGRHHSFELMPLSMALSNILSTNSFLRRLFSASSAFNRLASDTSMPASLDFHL